MTDDKVKELLEAKAEFEKLIGAGSISEISRILDAIAAFKPPKPKRGELWVNMHPSIDAGFFYFSAEVAKERASEMATRVAVHYREVLPGDENLVLVKPGKDWSDDEKEALALTYINTPGEMSMKDWEAVIDAIREKCRVM